MDNNTELDEKIEEFKNYLIESTNHNTLNKIEKLSSENKKLKEEIKVLSKQNDDLQKKNKTSITNDKITQIVVNQISQNNIQRIIESLFTKTFDENTYGVPLFWSICVNYYNNRKDVIPLLRLSGIEIPNELEDIILPHEWGEELLDKFFDTMYAHYNCNATIYQDNLRFWTYKMAAHPFDNNYFSCYDEIPWQFILRNPLLNSKKYAIKIAEEMNNGGHGIYFSKICYYQKLNQDILQTIIDNIKNTDNKMVRDFLIEHIDLVTNKRILDGLYPIVLDNRFNGVEYILKMPEKYQIKYAKSLDCPEKMINFLNKTKFSKEKKMEVLGNIFN